MMLLLAVVTSILSDIPAATQAGAPQQLSLAAIHEPLTLRSLASATSRQDRCTIFVEWLRSIDVNDAPEAGDFSDPILRLFRDDRMIAVFGAPYDKIDRSALHKSFEPCFSSKDLAREHKVKHGQFLTQSRPLIDAAFLSRPGPYEPPFLLLYVKTVRMQESWLLEAVNLVRGEPALTKYQAIAKAQTESRARLSTLSARELARLRDLLDASLKAQAAPITFQWLQDADAATQDTESARSATLNRAEISAIVRSLPQSEQDTWNRRFDGILDKAIRSDVQRLQSTLTTLKASASIEGLAEWRNKFSVTLNELMEVTASQELLREYSTFRDQYLQTRFSAWSRDLSVIANDRDEITRQRALIASMFPDESIGDDLSRMFHSDVFDAFDKVLRPFEETLDRKAAESVRAAKAALMLQTDGLTYGSVLRRIHDGEFSRVGIAPNDMRFVSLFGTYLQTFASQCEEHLPTDRVEMSTPQCVTERVTTNRFGVEVGRVCVKTERVGTGLYAKPHLWAAKRRLEDQIITPGGATLSGLAEMAKMLDRAFAKPSVAEAIDSVNAPARDIERLFALNECTSPPMMRFEENLRRYASGQTAK